MSRRLISSGSRFEAEIGYSRAVVDGDYVFVAGTTGYDYATMAIAGDVAAQCEQTFRNIDDALRQAGAEMRDVVRVTYILPNRDDWEACWPVTRAWLGEARPAATMLQAGLQTDEMKIEIQVTARLSRRPGDIL
jgi:enamine deaminase RidA (YjgF/YER057c/UK114 family)